MIFVKRSGLTNEALPAILPILTCGTGQGQARRAQFFTHLTYTHNMAQHTWKAWIGATRPWSFTASALTVFVSLAYLEWSAGDVHWWRGLWAIGAMVLFHAAGNTWSDWHDYRKGVDAADTHGVDTLTSGHFTPGEVMSFSLGLFALATAAGLGLMLCTGLPLLGIGAAGLALALLYPPLKYRAGGDVVILLAYCLLPALGTSYVALGRFEPAVLLAALPVGVLVNAILHANNTRDMRTDRRAGARSLAHALGVRGSVMLYVGQMFVPFIWVVVLVCLGLLPLWALGELLLLPLALRNCRIMLGYRNEADSAVISTLDRRSAQLQMFFSLKLISPLLIDLWLR